jgi:S1-C subfamily serine protease
MLGVWAIVFVMVWSLVREDQPTSLLDPTAVARPSTSRGSLTSDEKSTIDVFRQASPSVVYITSTQLRRDFFGFSVFEVPQGTGSGFVYDTDGHIVTNVHVINDAKRLSVTLADHSEWEARVVGQEWDKDIAVLKIDVPSERLKPLTIGTSNDLLVGQKVLAIGNPFGFDLTLTVGVVSALDREIKAITGRKIRGVIQTDAAINPGNSGGPLLDSSGRLIGVNTQIASRVGESAGIGFAVPVDIVNEIVPEIIRYGRVLRPGLGVQLYSAQQTQHLGIRGLLIDTVTRGSGAAEAGLQGTVLDARGYVRKLGDIIVRVADRDVRSANELRDVLDSFNVDDEVDVVFVRDDKVLTARIKLQYIN